MDVQKHCNALRARRDRIIKSLELPAYRDAQNQQHQVVRHYLDRSRELASACLFVADAGLTVPTMVFLRVLCEDLFLITWATRSEANAARLANAGVEALAHLAAVNLERGWMHVLKKDSREDHTRAMLPKIRKMAGDRLHIEQIARNVGLGGVYDVVYRPASLEVHGKTFGVFSSNEGSGAITPTLIAIISVLDVIMLVADNCVLRGGATEPSEILGRLFGLE